MKLYIISFLILWSVIFHAGLVEGSRQAKDVVVVSAKRVESEVQRTAENVRVYDEEYIHSLPARDLGEILKYIPGVDVKVVNQFSQATSLSIQGSESRHVLLMVDGIPFNTQLSGQANPVRIPIENIKQIEVIKGASSSAWGSSLGGVINVITKDTGSEGPVHGRFSTAYTEFSTTFNGLQLSGGNEHSGYYAAGSFFETDGIRDGAQAEASKFFVKGKTRVFDQMDLIASFGHSDLDVNDIIPDPFFGRMDIHQPTVATYGQLNADMEYDLLKIQAALKYNKQIIKTNTTFLDFGGVKTSISGLDSYVGLSLNASYPFFEEDLLVVGADVEK
ncbi:MAG: TonB-dependent receptor plug domain-containing protein, partial [Candidatus Omnitrophica bacterium]|nr:TonB-dependent receptor plug domain-containing protein [Candidatus Omnitrophota bacterium]